MQLDEELSSLEAELAYLCPREGVDAYELLIHNYSHVRNGEVERYSFVVLGQRHLDAVQLAPAGRFQEVQVCLGRSLAAVGRLMGGIDEVT